MKLSVNLPLISNDLLTKLNNKAKEQNLTSNDSLTKLDKL